MARTQQAGSALGWGFQLQTPWVVAALTGRPAPGRNLQVALEERFGNRALDTSAEGRNAYANYGFILLGAVMAMALIAAMSTRKVP